jgi:histidine triad (HIT) family protein
VDCIFCAIGRGEIPANAVFESDEIVAFRDLDPQAPTHVLVIPKEHFQDVADLSERNPQLAAKLLAATTTVAELEGLADGYRVVTNLGADGGQSVWHVHFHVLGGRSLQWPPG